MLASELGLSAGGGLCVLVAQDASHAARKSRLGLDDSGDIAVVEGTEAHRRILEALALYMYGDARECAAAAEWITGAQEAIPGSSRQQSTVERIINRRFEPDQIDATTIAPQPGGH